MFIVFGTFAHQQSTLNDGQTELFHNRKLANFSLRRRPLVEPLHQSQRQDQKIFKSLASHFSSSRCALSRLQSVVFSLWHF